MRIYLNIFLLLSSISLATTPNTWVRVNDYTGNPRTGHLLL
jgi:hypothetical protein